MLNYIKNNHFKLQKTNQLYRKTIRKKDRLYFVNIKFFIHVLVKSRKKSPTIFCALQNVTLKLTL